MYNFEYIKVCIYGRKASVGGGNDVGAERATLDVTLSPIPSNDVVFGDDDDDDEYL